MKSTRLLLHFVLALTVLGVTSTAYADATITIINGNAPGVGFNDPTPAAPVGGNPGTTVGQQRLLAFQHAAAIWGAELDSNVEIRIRAQFVPLACTATGAVLGSAGAATFVVNIPGTALYPGTEPNIIYPSALADKQSGVDVRSVFFGAPPDAQDINANFNVNLGQPTCLPTRFWYYGFDGNEGNGIDLVAVLLHEFGHGLGFQQLASLTSGALPLGLFDVYNRYLFDNTANKSWTVMTNAERAASVINPRNVAFTGPEAVANVPVVLRGTPMLQVTSPASIAGIKSVGTASFGPPLTAVGVTGLIVQGLDPNDGNGALTTDGCSALTNAADVAGRIALLDRGTCGFTVKVKNAQNAGAIAVLIANNVAGAAPGLGGADPTITIPSAGVSLTDANDIKGALASGVNAFLGLDETRRAGADLLGRPLIYTPNPVEPGSSVSHYDTSANPNQLMEPAINADLTHNVKPPFDLTLPLLHDIGWYPDTDVDGLANTLDACPNASDQRLTIFVGPTNTGIDNVIFTNGCSINDLITLLNDGAKNHGQFVSGVSHLGEALLAAGFLTDEEKDLLQRTAAQYK